MFTRLHALALTVLLAATASSQAHAAVIGFDPLGGAYGTVSIDTFTMSAGNALGYQVNAPVGSIAPGTEFDLLYQAVVGAGTLDAQNQYFTPNNEITVVARFPEVVTSLTPNTTGGFDANFALGGTGDNYFRMYASDRNASNLAGTGFDDGDLILEGRIIQSTGSFSTTTVGGSPTLFDQSTDGDNYGGFQTLRGSGGSVVRVQITDYDPNYFVSGFGPDALMNIALFSGSNNTPFTNINPSQQFAFAGVTPNRGAVNGEGEDFQFQADASVSFQVVPEPGSVAVFATLGIIGLGGVVRRRRKA